MENQYMQQAEQQAGQPAPRINQEKMGMDPMVRIVFVTLAVAIIGALAYFQPWKSMGNTAPAADAGAAAISTGSTPDQGGATQTVLEALSKIMLLPAGDEPVIYAIENAQELIAQQAFFAGAQNGDTLIIFPKNQKAVIYSGARNMVVNAGPLSANDSIGGAVPAQATQNNTSTQDTTTGTVAQ